MFTSETLVDWTPEGDTDFIPEQRIGMDGEPVVSVGYDEQRELDREKSSQSGDPFDALRDENNRRVCLSLITDKENK